MNRMNQSIKALPSSLLYCEATGHRDCVVHTCTRYQRGDVIVVVALAQSKSPRGRKPTSRNPLTKRQQDMQEDNATIAKTVSKILWKSINEVKDDLIGIPIRKRFGSGVWHDGVITAVTTKSASADNRNGSSISRCTIQYDPTAPTLPGIKAVDIPNQETLAVDETLELWIIAYDMMYGVPPTLKVKRPPTLFQRKQHKQASGDPYALTQFKGLLSYTERAHGGVTIEDLEASKLVLNRNPHSKATHVYGRMLPNAIHVSNSSFSTIGLLYPRMHPYN